MNFLSRYKIGNSDCISFGKMDKCPKYNETDLMRSIILSYKQEYNQRETNNLVDQG